MRLKSGSVSHGKGPQGSLYGHEPEPRPRLSSVPEQGPDWLSHPAVALGGGNGGVGLWLGGPPPPPDCLIECWIQQSCFPGSPKPQAPTLLFSSPLSLLLFKLSDFL